MTVAYQYLLHFWGQIENDNLVERELGIRDKYLWFPTRELRDTLKARIDDVAKKYGVMVVFGEEEGETVHLRTVAHAVFEYRGKNYSIDYDFGYGYQRSLAKYMFEDGNYACDCNRSMFINKKYPEVAKTKCGHDIEMVKFTVSLEV